MESFWCNVCGEEHPISVGLEIEFPRIISDMPIKESLKRVREFNGFYIVDHKMMFANGWIKIALEKDKSLFFKWKTWTSISKELFFEKYDEIEKGSKIEFEGNLESELPYYLNSIGLKTKTVIQKRMNVYRIEILIEEKSKLKQDQSKPISGERMIEIIKMIHHDPNFERRNFGNQIFEERLKKELSSVEYQFLRNGGFFVINFEFEGSILFQIVPSKILEKKGKKSGFGLHLPFDGDFEKKSKFEKQKYSKEFAFHILDEIPTFQIDLGREKNSIAEISRRIIQDVYEKDPEMIELDIIE